ncbi:MAG: DUF5682 family protein [Chloroflexota bacterium]
MSDNEAGQVHIFGIRHHGPGSARSLKQALEQLQPDCVLVEGPPDAANVLPMLAHSEMKPPVALLLYRADDPKRAVYYPFALFSPEWQAIKYALSNDVPVRFMDLPQSMRMAETASEDDLQLAAGNQPEEAEDESPATEEQAVEVVVEQAQNALRDDPLRWLAEAAGFSDGERWWEHMVEHRQDGTEIFSAILEMMTALRAEAEDERLRIKDDSRSPWHQKHEFDEAKREAYMRQTIRAAESEGFSRVAVVCGAWHAPVLANMRRSAKEDAALLKGLPTTKVQATWVPWTYGRLSYAGGYGAGIESPGWYHHLWNTPEDVSIRWMSRVARLLREQDLDASTAHVIEAVRLAETLAALRGRPLPGLPEMNEATLSVLLFGNELPMRLIHEKLIVGERLGEVPADTPMVPLQGDLIREQKRRRLPPEPEAKALDLDLRKENDLARSNLLHRLNLLGVPWGRTERNSGRTKGTFHELWQLQWQPEFAISLIEAGGWGNTVLDAATARVHAQAKEATGLPALTALVERAILADLPDAVGVVMLRVQDEAAVSSDVGHLMEALPPLAGVMRYGNVRGSDASMVGHVVAGLVARICIGLPGACSSLNDEAAAEMFARLMAVNSAVMLLENEEHKAAWQRVLEQLAAQDTLHGLISGRACRLLLDGSQISSEEAARRVGVALSRASEPAHAAAWVEGFLKGSGLALLHDEELWGVLDAWVSALQPDTFTGLLPLLRRTFSTFTAPERRQMGERVKNGPAHRPQHYTAANSGFDTARAEAVLPLLARLLGVEVAKE